MEFHKCDLEIFNPFDFLQNDETNCDEINCGLAEVMKPR